MSDLKWKTIKSVPKKKVVIVRLEERVLQSWYHVAFYSENFSIVGGNFEHDMPKATHWCEIPKFDCPTGTISIKELADKLDKKIKSKKNQK